MPMVQANGCQLNVRTDGDLGAPALMLCNSLGTTLHMWDAQVPALAQKFHVIRYDRRGHGQSDAPHGPYSMEMLGRDALAVMDALRLARVNWCGLSMGGMVGQWLGANAPERIERLILSNTTCFYADRSPWADRINAVREHGVAGLADVTMQRWFSEPFRAREPATVTRFKDMLIATPSAGYIGCVEAIRDMDHRALLPKIAARTLVIAGRHDPATTVEQAEYLVSHVSDARLVVLDAAHISNVEQPTLYTETVATFLT